MSSKRLDLNQENSSRIRVCEKCFKAMPSSYLESICPQCRDEALYKEVKEYILHNDVGEYELADKFNIPVSRVKEWINDGRIEYRKLK